MAMLDGSPATPDDLQALALVNYGHFTAMRVDNRRVRGLSYHLDRLVRDCRAVLGAELDRERVRELVRQVVADRTDAVVVRVTVYDPALEVGRPGAPAEPHLLVTTRAPAVVPAAPIRVESTVFARDTPRVKHVGQFGSMSRRRAAQLRGFDDALFTDVTVDGGALVSEGPTWNIGFFDGERVVWPDAEVLPGVTMLLLQQTHERTTVAPVRLADISGMRAAFVTSANIGVRPVTAVDGVEFPARHEIVDVLRKAYQETPPERL